MKVFKVKEGDKEIGLKFRNPTRLERQEADKIYNFTVAKLMKEAHDNGVPTLVKSKLDDFLRENDIWTVEDEQYVDDLRDKINESLQKLRKGGIKLSEGRNLAIEISENRSKVVERMSKRLDFENNTIESMAENKKFDFLLSKCATYSETGKPVFESVDDYQKRSEENISVEISRRFGPVYYGLDEEFESSLPENAWLKRYGFIDGEMNFIDKNTGEKISKDGSPVKEDLVKEYIESLLIGQLPPKEEFIDDVTIKQEEPPKTEG